MLEGSCNTGHAADLFGYGDGLGVDFVDKQVGQRKIADGTVVLMAVEIVGVSAEGFAQSVAVIKHGGDTVEAKTIEVELLKPIAAVGQEEVDDLVLAVVEAEWLRRSPG